MTAGNATLRALTRPGVFERIREQAARLAARARGRCSRRRRARHGGPGGHHALALVRRPGAEEPRRGEGDRHGALQALPRGDAPPRRPPPAEPLRGVVREPRPQRRGASTASSKPTTARSPRPDQGDERRTPSGRPDGVRRWSLAAGAWEGRVSWALRRVVEGLMQSGRPDCIGRWSFAGGGPDVGPDAGCHAEAPPAGRPAHVAALPLGLVFALAVLPATAGDETEGPYDGAWTPAELQALDRALHAANLTREDLTFKKDLTKGHACLPVVRAMLARSAAHRAAVAGRVRRYISDSRDPRLSRVLGRRWNDGPGEPSPCRRGDRQGTPRLSREPGVPGRPQPDRPLRSRDRRRSAGPAAALPGADGLARRVRVAVRRGNDSRASRRAWRSRTPTLAPRGRHAASRGRCLRGLWLSRLAQARGRVGEPIPASGFPRDAPLIVETPGGSHRPRDPR